MDIILTENIDGLGKIGDQLKVKDGYARNYLVPKGFAVAANNRNVKELEHQKREAARKLERVTKAAELLKQKIEGTRVEVYHRAGDEGKLYGAVTSMEIEAKLAGAGIEVDRKRILLEEPIKQLGDHVVTVKLDAGITADLKVAVLAANEG